jgi:hypothetical protein
MVRCRCLIVDYVNVIYDDDDNNNNNKNSYINEKRKTNKSGNAHMKCTLILKLFGLYYT